MDIISLRPPLPKSVFLIKSTISLKNLACNFDFYISLSTKSYNQEQYATKGMLPLLATSNILVALLIYYESKK